MDQPTITEDLFCENPHCIVGRWLVTMQSVEEQVWRIVAYFDDTPFLVAAKHPICPCCGQELMSHFAMDGGFASRSADEEGPLFDFIRTLL